MELRRPAAGAVVVAAGVAFLCGITLLGGEVADALPGKVFAFLQTTA